MLRDKISTPQTAEDLGLPVFALKPWNYYEEQVNHRNIFIQKMMTDPQVPAETQAKETVPEFFRNLKLTGIVIDGNPQAILQDPQSRESFFVHEGEGIKDAVLNKITTERVVLEYHGQLIELKQ